MRLLLACTLLLLPAVGTAQSAMEPTSTPPQLDYYLPANTQYDADIPTPEQVLGYQVGEWHARHDQVIEYYRAAAAASKRLQLIEYARSHEHRPLVLLVVSSTKNMERIEELRAAHVARLEDDAPSGELGPVFTWLGYGVHGNEPSGTNASLLITYYLAAARGEKVDRLLGNSVILIDPCLNPDGTARFAMWANSHRGKNLVADANHREHLEVWPGGRTNHYWFDLNRDWLLLTHPESRGRLREFHRWKPNLLTDFHEMGTRSTYFFQPGVPSRQNPNTPPENLDLTRNLAHYHAAALDDVGSLYYTEESFDDFYYGKGSTYPDINGCIGILFEQASSRGHLQKNKDGLLSFPFTIRNQTLTSFSSLEGALEMREELLTYQQEFFRNARADAKKDSVRAYVFGSPHDAARNYEFMSVLHQHGIHIHEISRGVVHDGHGFARDTSWIAPIDQTQHRLLKALFEQPTTFPDSTFYDVSTWTLPLSFGIPFAELTASDIDNGLIGARVETPQFPTGSFTDADAPYAYLFGWQGYYAPRAAQRLLAAGLKVRVATKPFDIATTDDSVKSFTYGTIVVPVAIQDKTPAEVATLLRDCARLDGVDVHPVGSGLTTRGIDLGSPSIFALEKPKVLLVIGRGVSGYESGEVWHLLDTRYDVEVSLVERDRIGRVDLANYTHVVLVSGGTAAWGGGEKLRSWVRAGGVLVSTRRSVEWVRETILGRDTPDDSGRGKKKSETTAQPAADKKAQATAESALKPSYADYDQLNAEKFINGAILAATIDTTHPLGYGYLSGDIALFRNTRNVMAAEDNPFVNVAQYTAEPLLSGYVSDANLDKLAETAAVCAERLGRGTVIRFADNPNFRGVWYGTNKMFANAIFFGHVIKDTSDWENK
ncbi:MAG: M14 family metallopeptidase [Planctomycetota bacterium]